MADKYIALDGNGNETEVSATVSSTGIAQAGKILAADASGHIDPSMMPTGWDTEADSIVTNETLVAGALVNIYNNAGTPTLRNADASAASAAKRAHGFVLAPFSIGALALVYRLGRNTAMSALTAGTEYFLSNTTAGAVMVTPPVTTGHLSQRVGEAISATELDFKPEKGIIRG